MKEVEKELIAAKLINIPTVTSQWKGKSSKLVEILKFKSRVPCFPPTKNDLKRRGGEDLAHKHKSQPTPKGVFSRAQYLVFRKWNTKNNERKRKKLHFQQYIVLSSL